MLNEANPLTPREFSALSKTCGTHGTCWCTGRGGLLRLIIGKEHLTRRAGRGSASAGPGAAAGFGANTGAGFEASATFWGATAGLVVNVVNHRSTCRKMQIIILKHSVHIQGQSPVAYALVI